MRERIRKELKEIAEEDYWIFATKLIPNINNLLGVQLPTVTMPYLQKNQLDDWTYNNVLQKITESLKVYCILD